MIMCGFAYGKFGGDKLTLVYIANGVNEQKN
jgi:hypothetical protein